MPPIITMAVVPFGSTLFGVPMVIADINIGILYVFAISSLGVYGIVLAGWASNSKYPFLGCVRSSSQMLSYELSLGLAVIPVFLLVGGLRLTDVVRYQIEHGWLIAPFVGDWLNPGKWLLGIPMLVSFVAVRLAVVHWLRPHLLDPHHVVRPLTDAHHLGFALGPSGAEFVAGHPSMTNAWVLSNRIVDKAGQPRYLLTYRVRISRQLEQWLTKIQVTTERQAASSRRSRLASPTMFASCNGSRSAVTRKSSTSERLSALEELLKLSVNGTTSYFDGTAAAELTQPWQTIYARNQRGVRRPDQDKSLQALLPVLAGQMPVIMYADREREIERALDLAQEFKLKAIIAGGASACAKAGIPVAGGHTIDSVEPIYGLAVIGSVHPDRIKRNSGAKPGDALILGKPLGVGVYSAALRKDALSASAYRELIACTTQLNTPGVELGSLDGVHAMTDVTGFGLLGHLLEMCRASAAGAAIQFERIPLLRDTVKLATEGHITGASSRNFDGYGEDVAFTSGDPIVRSLLTDPQTSGGLLVACANDHADNILEVFRRNGFDRAATIGSMVDGPPQVTIR